MTIKTAVFTIVSLNYGAFSRTLMESISAVHPEWDRHVLLVDRHADPESVGGDLFTASLVEDKETEEPSSQGQNPHSQVRVL